MVSRCTRSVHLVKLLVLVLSGNALLLFEDAFAVFIKLESGDHAVGWVDGDLGLLTVRLLFNDFLNVNASASAVHGLDFAFLTLEVADDDLDLVTFADGDGAHFILGFQFSGEVSAHHNTTHAAGGSEIGLSRLSALARYTYTGRVRMGMLAFCV